MRLQRPVALMILATLTACASGDTPDGAEGLGGETDGLGDSSEGGSLPGDGSLPDSGFDTEGNGEGEGGGRPSADESGDGSSDDAGSCTQGGYRVDVEAATPRVMLVLDKSLSMTNVWDHDQNPATADVSRWNSLHATVDFLLDQFGAQMEFGAQLFPSAEAYLDEPTNAYSCRVESEPEVAIAPDNAAAIMASLPTATDDSISGGTPATAGFTTALEHLKAVASSGPRAIVLVTDGAANCNPVIVPEETLFVYDEALRDAVQGAFEQDNIPTYVVGVNILDEMGTKPATNPHQSLTEVANVSGAARENASDSFYNTFNEAELGDALQEVAQKISCTIPLADEPEHPDLLGIQILGKDWERLDDCSQGDGWRYTAADGPYTSIELCGAACDGLDVGVSISVSYGCPQ